MKTLRALGAAILFAALGRPVALAQPKPTYFDNRSTAEAVVRSHYNALTREEYGRAWSYWDPDAVEEQLGPFVSWRDGYQSNESFTVVNVGKTDLVGLRGTLNYTVPFTLTTTLSDSSQQWAVGCFKLYSIPDVPGLLDVPHFVPIQILRGQVEQVENEAAAKSLLAGFCEASNLYPVSPTPPR